MDKLTSRFQSALADAQSLAVGRDNQFMEPAHVLGALLDQQDGSTRPLLVKAGANVAKLRKDLDAALDKLPTVQGTPGDVHVSQDLGRLLNVTDKLAQQRKDEYISSELFVLASFEDKNTLDNDHWNGFNCIKYTFDMFIFSWIISGNLNSQKIPKRTLSTDSKRRVRRG